MINDWIEELTNNYRRGFIHHAHLVVGESSESWRKLQDFLTKVVGIGLSGNPDVWQEVLRVFTIDHSRFLIKHQSKVAWNGKRRWFVFAVSEATLEAQNALLKVLEEPASGVHLFFLIPTAEIFLPTVRSRCLIIGHQSNLSAVIGSESYQWLHWSLVERQKFLDKLLADKKVDLHQVLDNILNYLESISGQRGKIISKLMYVRRAAHQPGSLPRTLLEFLIFTLPPLKPMLQ